MPAAYTEDQVQLMREMIERVSRTCADPAFKAEAATLLDRLEPGRPGDRRKPLTDRQREIMDAIRSHLVEYGAPPTVRELGQAVGIRSPNGVMCHIRFLRRKGYLREARGNTSRDLVPV